MRARLIGSATVISVLIVGLLAAQAPQPASALSPGVSFSADDLSTWQTNGTVWALGSADGKVIAGGTFSQVLPPAGGSGAARSQNALVILDAETGEPDACQFPVAFSGSTPTIRSVAVSDDESTVYVGGNFSSIGGQTRLRVAALDLESCTVLPFRATNISSTVIDMEVSGNTLYIGGQFNSVNSQTRNSFAALNATTGALLPWTANANRVRTDLPAAVGQGRALAVSPDGTKVVVGGDMFEINGVYSHSIAIVSAADPTTGEGGAVLRTYPAGFIPDTSITKDIVSDGDKFYIANEGTGGGVFDGKAAFSWDTGDQIWRDTCLGATQALLVYGGTLYSASHAHDCNGINAFPDGLRRYFLAQNSDTMEILGWMPLANDGIGEGIGPRALTVATGTTTGKDYLWAGGEFTRINGKVQQSLTRFGPDDIGAPAVPAVTATATSDGTIQVSFRSVVDPDDSDLTYRVYRQGTTEPIWTGVAKSLWWERPQVTFVDKDVAPGTRYGYRVEVSDGTNTSARSALVYATATGRTSDYSSMVRAASPVLYSTSTISGGWLLDGSATDSKTAAIPLLLKDGASVSEDSAIATSPGTLTLDGVDDYAISDQLRLAPTTYSIETWIKTTTTRGGKIVGYGNGRPWTNTNQSRLSGNYDRHIYMQNDGRIRFGVYSGGTRTIVSPSALNDGQWHHIVATQGAEGMRLFVDGVVVASDATTTAQPFWGVWRVGGDQLAGWPDQPSSNFFQGSIDEVAVYPGVLAENEVAAHYVASGRTLAVNEAPTDAYGASVFKDQPLLYWRLADQDTTAVDSSYLGRRSGVYQPDTIRGVSGAVDGNAAAQFAGNSGSTVATAQSLAPTPTFSAEVWFSTSTNAGGKLFGFENVATGNGSNYDKHLYMTNSGQLIFGTYAGSAKTITSPGAYNDGKWHHAVAVVDATGRKLYVDGGVVAQSSDTGAENGNGYWRLGGGNIGGWPQSPTNHYFTGSLDEFAVYSTALTADQIDEHYLAGLDDGQAPSVPTTVTAQLSGPSVHLTWSESIDDHAVAGYRIYRGTSAGFAVDEDSLIGTSEATEYADLDLRPGTYFYRIVAVDASGNASDGSEPVSLVVADTEPPTAPAGIGSEVSGTGDVTITWTAATDDVAVVDYVIYRSSEASFTPSAETMVGSSAGLSYAESSVSPGTYYYMVIAQDLAGNQSSPSSAVEVVVTAPDTSAPSEPTVLTATVEHLNVALAWEASTDNVGVTGYEVHRGTSSDFEPSAATLRDTVTTESFTEDSEEAGDYVYKVVAIDAAGNRSAAGVVAVTTTAPADSVAPTTPGGVTASSDGQGVRLAWTASTDNIGVTGYEVHRGVSPDFQPNADTRIASVTVPSYDDASPGVGTLYYKVRAFDAAGNVSAAATASIVIAAGDPVVVAVAPTADSMTIQAAPTTNYGSNNQLAARGGASAQQSFLTFALPSAPAGTELVSATLKVRTSTDASATSVDSHQVDLVQGSWAEGTVTWNNRPTTVVETLGELTPAPDKNSPLSVALLTSPLASSLGSTQTIRIAGTTGTDNVRLWSREAANSAYRPTLELVFAPVSGQAGDGVAPSTPTDIAASVGDLGVSLSWTASTDNVGVSGYELHRGTSASFTPSAQSRIATISTTTYVDVGVSPGTYYYRVVATDAAGNVSEPSSGVSATVPAPPEADTDAPSSPSALTASAGTVSVSLSWAPSVDNVGVASYSVYRGATASFVATATTLIAEGISGTSFTDTSPESGLRYYRVVAHDSAGNASVASAAVAVSYGQPVQTTTIELRPTADAAVYQSAPTSNYGVSNQLAVRGLPAQQESFLGFDLSSIPDNATITSANLRVRTSTDATADSAGQFTISIVSGSWTESAVTWNNRPGDNPIVVGLLEGATTRNADTVVALDATRLSADVLTLRISSDSTDNLRLWSNEASAVNYRPVLTITYSAP